MVLDSDKILNTEQAVASNQDSGNWLQSLLTAGVDAYSAITNAKATAAAKKLQAQLAVPSAAQPAGNSSGISSQTLMIAGGVVAVGLVLVLALRK